MGGNSFRTIIRLIAGGYICYLGYQLIKGYLYPTEETGDPVWFMMLFGILFLAIGAFLIVNAIRNAAAAKNEEEDDDNEPNETDDTNESELPDNEATADETEASASEADNAPHTMTIAERIRRLSDESEEEN